MDFSDWQQTAVNPLAVQLDDENPRIAAKGLDQAEIRELLLEHEGVADLAHKIIKAGGLFPHDLLIVGTLAERLTVLEGNRRIAALQMLLDPSLIPDAFRDKVPRADGDLRQRLQAVPAVLAPDRGAADHVIARIHAFSARKGWSPLAKYRYAHSRREEKESLPQIADDLGSDVSEVRKFIRRYNIYREVLTLGWSDEEEAVLRGDELPVTPFLYPFERTPVRALIGDVFDAEGHRNPKYNRDTVNASLKKLARDALIPETLTGRSVLSTRGTGEGSIELYFQQNHQELIAERTRIDAPVPQTPPSQPSPTPPRLPPRPPARKPNEFFESFSVPKTVDQRIVTITYEISRLDYKKFPIAAGMLLRALLEETLREHLKLKDKWDSYKKEAGAHDGLASLISFCAVKSNRVFSDHKTTDALTRFHSSPVKRDLDNIVHNRYGLIRKEGLILIKPYVRGIIESVIRDEWS